MRHLLLACIAALLPASALADHCYKDRCNELDSRAVGSNYESLTIDGDIRGRTVLEGYSGGELDASYLGDTSADACGGYASILPDHRITVEDEDVEATFELESLGRTVLIIHGPQGWLCVGDGRNDPEIEVHLREGDYRVWVAGPRDDGDDYELALSWQSDDWDRDDWFDDRPHHDDHDRPDWDDDDRPGRPDWDDDDRPGRPGRPDWDDDRRPPPTPITYSFVGRFEEVDVRFDGDSAADVAASCTSFMSRGYSGGMVDDIEVSGRSFRNVYSWWDEEALCAIAALNAMPSHGSRAMVSVTVEDAPLLVPADVREATDLLRSYLPSIVGSTLVDDVTVDGVPHHNTYSYWDTEQIISLIVANAAPAVGRYRASGTIEDVAFSFAADDINVLSRECRVFVDSMFPTPFIDDVVVNGIARHNGPSWWSAEEVCMIITSLAD